MLVKHISVQCERDSVCQDQFLDNLNLEGVCILSQV